MLPADGDGGLFLATITVPPGDPGALGAGARTYAAAQAEIERSRASLGAATEQVGGPAWQGMGASAYATFTGDLAATYGLTAAGLAQGASTLRAYSAALSTAQETARQANAAVAVSNATATRLLAAEAASQQAQASATSAAQAASTAEDQATSSPHSASAQVAAQTARSAANDAQTTADGAANQVSALSSVYDADRARALNLISEAQTQARQASTAASAGFDAAVSQVAGAKPHAPHGGANGVPGSSKWLNLTDDVNAWAAAVGAGWTGFAGFKFLQAARTYVGSVEKLGAAESSYASAYDGFYGVSVKARTQGYFDMQADKRAVQAAQTAEDDAKGDLEDSLSGTSDLVGKIGVGLYGVAIVSDIYTEFRPSDAFGSTGEVLDRVNSGLNLAASGLALADAADLALAAPLMAVPGVDLVVGGVLIGTAVYATAELVWQHYGTDIKHDLHDVAHWADDVGSFLGL
jgi:hypothetical protein